jgi:hypothetical protein
MGRITLTLLIACATLSSAVNAGRSGNVMEGNRGESEAGGIGVQTRAALVRRTVRDIDTRADVNVLLMDLLCAAWPTEAAQSQ